jgi:opacity protein-like surface antigen
MTVRTFVAVALLAPAVAFAAPASSPSRTAPAQQAYDSGIAVGGFVGYETADVSGVSLRLDGELPFKDLSPQVRLSWVGSFGYSHLTTGSFAGGQFTANVFKFVPAARFTFPLAPQFSVTGDVGLGLAIVSASIDVSIPGIPPFIPAQSFSESHSTVNLMMRLGGGAWYDVNPKMRLGLMLEFDPIFGDFGFTGASSQTTFIVQGGAMFKL